MGRWTVCAKLRSKKRSRPLSITRYKSDTKNKGQHACWQNETRLGYRGWKWLEEQGRVHLGRTSSAFALGPTLENRTHTGCSVITACVLCFYQGIYLTAHYSLLSHAPASYLTCPSQHVDSFHFHKQKRSAGLPKRVTARSCQEARPEYLHLLL